MSISTFRGKKQTSKKDNKKTQEDDGKRKRISSSTGFITPDTKKNMALVLITLVLCLTMAIVTYSVMTERMPFETVPGEAGVATGATNDKSNKQTTFTVYFAREEDWLPNETIGDVAEARDCARICMEMMPKCNAFIINLLRGLCHIGIVTEECFDIIKIADKEYQKFRGGGNSDVKYVEMYLLLDRIHNSSYVNKKLMEHQ